MERYPGLDKVQLNSRIGFDAFSMTFAKLPVVEKQVYESILNRLLSRADENDIAQANFTLMREFLKKEGLEDTPSRFQKKFLADLKSKLKSAER